MVVSGGVASADDADPSGDEPAVTGFVLRPALRTIATVLTAGAALTDLAGVSGIGVDGLGETDDADGTLPTCRLPVGEGAKRVVTDSGI